MFFLNERNCKYCVDGIDFLSELFVNRILIVSIVINKICSKIYYYYYYYYYYYIIIILIIIIIIILTVRWGTHNGHNG